MWSLQTSAFTLYSGRFSVSNSPASDSLNVQIISVCCQAYTELYWLLKKEKKEGTQMFNESNSSPNRSWVSCLSKSEQDLFSTKATA